MKSSAAASLLSLCLLPALSCVKPPYNPPAGPTLPEKTVDVYAPQTQVDPWGANSTDEIVTVRQNWTPEWRLEWAFTSQGSRMIPYDWYLALENHDGTGKFHSPETNLRYRYLLQKPSDRNPDGLP